MNRYVGIFFAVVFSIANCFGDTFIHRTTRETFNGFVVQKKRGIKTLVNPEKKKPQFLNISDYEISYNHLGRKNMVFIFSLKDSLDLMCEAEAFEQAILVAANQGPLFILIEIDSMGGRIDLSGRICNAIARTYNCLTVAFVNGGDFDGAFSEAAMISLACDKLCMHRGTSIGAQPPTFKPYSPLTEAPKESDNPAIDKKAVSRWQQYCIELAELHNRPGILVKAMLDKEVEVIEVVENEKHLFIAPEDKSPEQVAAYTWSEKGSLLTLTAEQAVTSGIADKVVVSTDELFSYLDAAKAKQVRDRKIPKARRDFERVQRRINAILSSIDFLKEQAGILKEEFAVVDERFQRANRVTHLDHLMNQRYDLERLAADRDIVLNRLSGVLNELIRAYNTALSLAAENADLSHHLESLEQGLETTSDSLRQVRFQPVY